MKMTTRRTTVKLTAATALMAVLDSRRASLLAQPTPPAVRHNVNSPEGQAMLQIYAAAVKEMNDQTKFPEGVPRSWLFQWYTHAVRSDRTVASELARIYPSPSDPNRALANEMWNTCEAHFDQSRSNFFLPWHRMFVLYFEQIIRIVSGKPGFTLPYWDYTKPTDQVLPAQFRMPNDPIWGSLYRPNRRPQVLAGGNVATVGGLPLNLDAMKDTSYVDTGASVGFCQNLDQGLHGALHVDVGNTLGMGRIPYALTL